MYRDITAIGKAGFIGFRTIAELWEDSSVIPKAKGVYMILHNAGNPKYLAKGVGGFHKQRDPNLPIEQLASYWINNCRVLYIGKAGGEDSSQTLYKRLRQYLDFGRGKPVGHYGGRLIWQLQHHPELLVAWKLTPRSDPREKEKKLIHEFEAYYGKLPFANLMR